ncbi:MAG TPA: hypothetical protein VK927_06890, partial [Adhaeribacter sp.]|nr:hypothetical protein [Adhaeribacter sp.]
MELTIPDAPNRKLYLLDFTGYQSRIIDSVMTDAGGKAAFTASGKAYEGMYRLLLQQAPTLAEQKFLDLYYGGQPVKLSTTLQNPEQDARFLSKGESGKYHELNRKMQQLNQQEQALDQTLTLYPVRDKYCRQTGKQLEQVKKEQNK